MKQNLTKKTGNNQFFLVTGIIPAWLGKSGLIGLIFSVRRRFLRSWVNNLMVFKKSCLGLEKIGGHGLVT